MESQIIGMMRGSRRRCVWMACTFNMATIKKKLKTSIYVFRCLLLGAWVQHCEKTELLSSCPVCPPVWNNSAPTGRSSVRLDIGDFYAKKVSIASKCGENRKKINDTLYEHLPHLWRYLAYYGISTQLTIYV